MVFSRRVAIRVQPYFGYRSRTRLALSLRVLRSRPSAFGEGSRRRAVMTMLGEFASREAAGVPVRLVIDGPDGPLIDCEEVSDAEGFVHFDRALEPAWDLPEKPVWEQARLHWMNEDGPQSVEAHVLAPARGGDLAVISDIDDTIIETGVTGGPRAIAKNWRRIFAQLPHERIAVPGADAFYGSLGGGTLHPGEKRGANHMGATRRPFFYISSSPWNLFSYIVAFMRVKNLPLGPLLLRDWGLNRETFGSASHGAHKTAAIESLLHTYPELRFALIGDDTQGDLPAFAHAAEAFPGRVAAVFLRKATTDVFSPEEDAARLSLERGKVPLWLGATYEEGIDFLRTLGFTPGGETEQIVKAVEKVEEAGEEPEAADAGAPGQASVPVQRPAG